jgi:esterase
MTVLRPEEIYYRIHGDPSDKPPLVLLHGLLGFAANWGKIWPHFAESRQVLVLDQRGHGRSAQPEFGYSPDNYAADLHSLLNHLGWKKVHLLGHSMGGRAAMHFASTHPEYLASLILEDSGAEARPDRIHWIKGLLGSVPVPFQDREAAKVFFDTEFSGDPMLSAFLHANLTSNQDGEIVWRFYAPGMIETIEQGRAKNSWQLYCRLKVPTLLIRGEQSAEFTQDEAERMAECRKGSAELALIPNASHWVHADQPQAFCAAVEKFITSIS